MADRPIIFSGPMVRALLEGRKTQTRRILKPQPKVATLASEHLEDHELRGWECVEQPDGRYAVVKRMPYAPGDRLWVKENAWICPPGWTNTPQNPMGPKSQEVGYQADDLRGGTAEAARDYKLKLHPSIFMPRWASRLTLIVEAVKVERLQDISREDAIAEGATAKPNCSGFQNRYEGWSMDWREPAADHSLAVPQAAFGNFINQLHGGPRWNLKNVRPLWDQNPWVVAVSFRVVRGNIDAPEAA